MQQMYDGIVNSPITELAASITDIDTTIEVLNGNALPEAPNIAVIGQGENAETILYNEKAGNILADVTRGFQGIASSWSAGIKVSRNFTEYDYKALKENIEELNNNTVENKEVTKSPIGFPNRTDSTFSFDKTTRTFAIEPIGASYDVYFKEKKHTKGSIESVVIPDTTGLHFLYFNKDTGTLETSMDFQGLDNMIYIAYIYWNADQATEERQFSPGDERHGTVMDKATHAYLHEVVGAEWIRGLQAYGYELNNTTSIDAVKLSLTSGVVRDEDLINNIIGSENPTEFYEQKLQNFAKLPVMYKEGANGAFKQDLATEYPFKNTPTGRVNYNQYTGTEWQQTEVTNGNFVAYFIVYTGLMEEPIKVVQGQRQDVSLADAQANNDHRNINWGDMPFQEFKILYRLILQTSNSYTNDRKVAIREVLDLRAERRTPSGGAGGVIPSAHSNLTGLDYNNSGHTGFASQAALNEHKADLVNPHNVTAVQVGAMNSIAKSIPNGDYNQAITPGWYSGAGSGAINGPPFTGIYGVLLVQKRGSDIFQFNIYDYRITSRLYINSTGVWTNWTTLITDKQESWINATLENGWTGTLRYRKSALSQLEIQVLGIKGGLLDNGVRISTLPSGYVPSARTVIATYDTASGKTAQHFIVLDTNGGVYIRGSSAIDSTGSYNANAVLSI